MPFCDKLVWQTEYTTNRNVSLAHYPLRDNVHAREKKLCSEEWITSHAHTLGVNIH